MRQKNLYERLRPELKAALEERYKDLPNTLKEIKEELESEFYYTHVKYWVYSDLRFLTIKAFGQQDTSPSNYFLPE
jgi:hypothetical protein